MAEITCPHCNQLHDSLAQFCPATGKSLSLSQTCPECGEDVQPGWVACAFCGSKLGKDQTQKPKWWNRYPIRWVIVIIGVLLIPVVAYLIINKITEDPVDSFLNQLTNIESFQATLVWKDLFEDELIYRTSSAKFEPSLAAYIKDVDDENNIWEYIYKDGQYCTHNLEDEWLCTEDVDPPNPVDIWKKIIRGEQIQSSATVVEYGFQKVNIEGTNCNSFFLIEKELDARIVQSKNELCFDPKTNLPLMMVTTREILSDEGKTTSGRKEILNIYAINEPVEINLPPGISPGTEEDIDPNPTDQGEDVEPQPQTSSIAPLTHTLPVMIGTPVPQPNKVISPENADQIVELARYGKGIVHNASWSSVGDTIEIFTTNGIFYHDPISLVLKQRKNIGTQLEFVSFTLSPDNTIFAIGHLDGTISVWDIPGEKKLHTLSGHNNQVISLAFSPDGKTLASGSAANDGLVILWDVVSGSKIQTIVNPPMLVSSLAFSPDGKLLAAAPHDGTVRLWDIESGNNILVLYGFSFITRGIYFSPQGEHLITGSMWPPSRAGGLIQLWDISNGREIHSFVGGDELRTLALSEDGRFIASGHRNGDIHIWDIINKYESLLLSGHNGSIISLEFSPDGKKIVSSSKDATVRTWDAVTGHQEEIINGFADSRINAFAFSPTIENLAFSWQYRGAGDGKIDIRQLSNGVGREDPLGFPEGISTITYSPDGDFIAISQGEKKIFDIFLWDVVKDQAHSNLVGHTDTVKIVEFSPDGELLVSGAADNTIRLWDLATGFESDQFFINSGVTSLAFSPDGQVLASGSRNGDIKLIDINNGHELYVLLGHVDGVTKILFSPEGKELISVSHDKTMRRWDVQNGTEIGVLSGVSHYGNNTIFSPDGNFLAIGMDDRKILIIDRSRGNIIFPLEGHTKRINGLAFSPDGNVLASGSDDDTVRLWNLNNGLQLIEISSYSFFYYDNGLRFSEDGRILTAVSSDGTSWLWGIPP